MPADLNINQYDAQAALTTTDVIATEPVSGGRTGKTAISEVLALVETQSLDTMQAAMSGDLVMVITPETAAPEPTSAAWTRDVTISIQTAAGAVHTWLNQAYASTASIADDSTAGTATIPSTTLTLVAGEATITVSGDAADWLDTETDTLTIGNISIMGYTVTGGTSVETFTAP